MELFGPQASLEESLKLLFHFLYFWSSQDFILLAQILALIFYANFSRFSRFSNMSVYSCYHKLLLFLRFLCVCMYIYIYI